MMQKRFSPQMYLCLLAVALEVFTASPVAAAAAAAPVGVEELDIEGPAAAAEDGSCVRRYSPYLMGTGIVGMLGGLIMIITSVRVIDHDSYSSSGLAVMGTGAGVLFSSLLLVGTLCLQQETQRQPNRPALAAIPEEGAHVPLTEFSEAEMARLPWRECVSDPHGRYSIYTVAEDSPELHTSLNRLQQELTAREPAAQEPGLFQLGAVECNICLQSAATQTLYFSKTCCYASGYCPACVARTQSFRCLQCRGEIAPQDLLKVVYSSPGQRV